MQALYPYRLPNTQDERPPFFIEGFSLSVYERFVAGDTVEHLARKYRLHSEEIQRAIRMECRRPPLCEPGLTDD